MSLFGDELEAIWEIDPLTGEKITGLDEIILYPASHYVTPRPTLQQAIPLIKAELKERIAQFERDDVIEILREADADHDGVLSKEEFSQWVHAHYTDA